MRVRQHLLLVAVAIALLATSIGHAWVATIGAGGTGRGVASAVAATADGDVVASGVVDTGGADGMQFVVAPLMERRAANDGARFSRTQPQRRRAIPRIWRSTPPATS